MDSLLSATIILPAYNEETAIGATLAQLCDQGLGTRYEVIVVDDGSTDNTARIVREFPDVQLVSHTVNKGYGAALKTGIRRAGTRKIIIMDSDGQHTSECIDQMVDMLDTFPMVIGERTADSHQVRSRLLGKRLIRLIGEYLLEQKLPDFNSGFRGFRTDAIRSILGLLPNGFSMSTTSTMAFLKMGYDVGTLPIEVKPRVGRKSNVNFLRDGSKTILLICRVIMLFNPLRIFFPASVLVGLVGAGWGVYGYLAAQRLPNSSIVIITLSMLLFLLGLLADQISMLNFSWQLVSDKTRDASRN